MCCLVGRYAAAKSFSPSGGRVAADQATFCVSPAVHYVDSHRSQSLLASAARDGCRELAERALTSYQPPSGGSQGIQSAAHMAALGGFAWLLRSSFSRSAAAVRRDSARIALRCSAARR